MANGYDILMKIDDKLIGINNLAKQLKFSFLRYQNKYNLSRNIELKNRFSNERCFIIGNGPSIKTQNLKLLKGEKTFVVNHFYKHPNIHTIDPSFYCIIDPKLQSGEWPLSMLDEVKKTCPNTEIFLSALYQDKPEILEFSKTTPLNWIFSDQLLHTGSSCSTDLTKSIGGVNVVSICLYAAIYMGFRDIYLLGVDCNGIFFDLIDRSSHFYAAEKENIGDNDPHLIIRHLRSSIQGLRGWSVIANKFKDSPVNIINLTAGGLLDVFPREKYETLFSEITSK